MVALSGWMLYTMWAVLGLIGLNMLLDLYRSMVTSTFSVTNLTAWLGDIVTYVFPLLLTVLLVDLDPTGWIVPIFYYIGGIGVTLTFLLNIKSKL